MGLRREVWFSLPPKSKICPNSNICLLYIFPCIFQLTFLPYFGPSWIISFHPWPIWAISSGLGHLRPFHFVWAIFRPFHFGHPVWQGRGWSIYQFKISFNLEIKIKSYEEDSKEWSSLISIVQFWSSLLLSLETGIKTCDTMSSL